MTFISNLVICYLSVTLKIKTQYNLTSNQRTKKNIRTQRTEEPKEERIVRVRLFCMHSIPHKIKYRSSKILALGIFLALLILIVIVTNDNILHI
jgi:hypothetical protein